MSLRIAVIPERLGSILSPCGTIRLSAFFDEIGRQRDCFDVRYLLLPELDNFSPHVIIWQRVALPNQEDIERLGEIATCTGARLIYDLDDNLLDVEQHGEGAAYSKMVASVRASLAIAHEVWVSTERLAARIAGSAAGTVVVLANALDPVLWAEPGPERQFDSTSPRFRMLYMGTRTHDEDFQLVEAALESLHRRSPGMLELTMIGVRASGMGNGDWLKTLSPPSYVGASYPAFVNWFREIQGFDLGMAPLVSNAFNDCKSSIKVLDYAALGIPTLASDVPAYQSYDLRNNENVFLVNNEPEKWVERINGLIQQRELLRTIAQAARRLIETPVFQQATESRRSRVYEQSALKGKN